MFISAFQKPFTQHDRCDDAGLFEGLVWFNHREKPLGSVEGKIMVFGGEMIASLKVRGTRGVGVKKLLLP